MSSISYSDKTEHEFFKVTKLFGKYDIVLDLEKRCNVIIGANGVGKSTVLRLFYDLITGDFLHIGYVPYESLSLVVNNPNGTDIIKVHINYTDIFPDIDYVCSAYNENVMHEYNAYPLIERSQIEAYGYDPREEGARLKAFLEELKSANLYESFIYALYEKKDQTATIKQFNNNAGKNWDIALKNLPILTQSTTSLFIVMFSGSKVEKDFSNNPHGFEAMFPAIKPLLVDLVRSYSLKNEYIYESFFTDSVTKWTNSYPYERKIMPMLKPKIALEPPFFQEIREKEFDTDIFSNLGGPLACFDDSHKKRTAYEAFNALKNDSELDINKLINVFYFSSEFILDINNRAQKYIHQYYEMRGKIDEKNLKTEFRDELISISKSFSDKLKLEYLTYVKPILVNGSFFDYDVTNINTSIDKIVTEFEDNLLEASYQFAYRKCLFNFIKEVLPLCKDSKNMSKEVHSYQTLLRKYLRDKSVIVRPSGLYIHDSQMRRTENKLFITYDRDAIDLSVISSGERKLIILFAATIFGCADCLLLDEPELSLSLVWQKTILPDLIKCNDATQILAATHSPYIVSAESMKSYITYLPQNQEEE